MVQLGKYSGLHCIWFKLNDFFSNVSKCIKRQDDIEFLKHKWNSHCNSPVIIGLLWWRYCGGKYCELMGKKIKGQWWKGHEWPATVWKASQWNLQFGRQRVIQENRHISQTTIVEILNTGLPMSKTLLQNLCAWWELHKFTPEMKTATKEAHQHLLTCYESDSTDFLHSNVTGTSVRYITMTQNWKAGSLNIVTPLLPEKIQDSTFYWKMHVHNFLGL